jgi:hypothetical protein
VKGVLSAWGGDYPGTPQGQLIFLFLFFILFIFHRHYLFIFLFSDAGVFCSHRTASLVPELEANTCTLHFFVGGTQVPNCIQMIRSFRYFFFFCIFRLHFLFTY